MSQLQSFYKQDASQSTTVNEPADLTVPGLGSTVSVTFGTTAYFLVGQDVFISDGINYGYFRVTAVSSSTVATLLNLSCTAVTINNGATTKLTGFAGNTSMISEDPIGSIRPWVAPTIPAGHLKCEGQSLLKTDYPDLFNLLQGIYGSTATHFNLPDLRGQFLRGLDDTSTIDPNAATRTDRGDGTTGANVGTKQAYQAGNHSHSMGASGYAQVGDAGLGYGYERSTNSTRGVNFSGIGGTASESRPVNTAVFYIIKAFHSYRYASNLEVTREFFKPSRFEARLSIDATDPVGYGTSSSLYLHPYEGNAISLFVDGQWVEYELTTPVTFAIGTCTDLLPYDVFVFSSGGVVTIEKVAWTSDTTRATALTLLNGIRVKTGETNKRFIGTFYSKGSNTIDINGTRTDIQWTGSNQTFVTHVGLCNHYNAVPITNSKVDFSGTYNQNTLVMCNTFTNSNIIYRDQGNTDYSRVAYASTGLRDKQISVDFNSSAHNGNNVISGRIAWLRSHAATAAIGVANTLANVSLYAPNSQVEPLFLEGSEVTSSGYNPLAVYAHAYSGTNGWYGWGDASIIFKGWY